MRKEGSRMSLLVDIEKKLGAFTLHAQFETSGGIMALLGASGSGKRVTLKCITGIMTPDRAASCWTSRRSLTAKRAST